MNTELQHKLFMQRCLELASTGMGFVAPNPMVGAVVVHNGKVIAEGFHREFGKAHAEVVAINAVKDEDLLRESTLYVNLEPCAHTGKTPPCCDLILKKGIPKVVIGTIDPNSVVAGKGMEALKKNGVSITCGILEKECRELNIRFFTFHEKHRPYIILKWAQSKDGYIDKIRKPGEPIGPNWISNPLSRTLVHKWRAQEQAIMVGTNTIVIDNPELNVRHWKGRSPIRIVPDRRLRIPEKANIFNNKYPTILYNERKSEIRELTQYIKIDFEHNELNNILKDLYNRQIISILVEGGKKLLESMIRENLWDEARVFTGAKIFENGIKAPELDKQYFPESILNDEVCIYRNIN